MFKGFPGPTLTQTVVKLPRIPGNNVFIWSNPHTEFLGGFLTLVSQFRGWYFVSSRPDSGLCTGLENSWAPQRKCKSSDSDPTGIESSVWLQLHLHQDLLPVFKHVDCRPTGAPPRLENIETWIYDVRNSSTCSVEIVCDGVKTKVGSWL